MPTTQSHTLHTANDGSSKDASRLGWETPCPIPNRVFSFALVSENSIHERLNQLGVESYQLA